MSDAVSDQTAKGNTDTVEAVPVANDSGLLFTGKPHAGKSDFQRTSIIRQWVVDRELTKARIGNSLEHSRDETKSNHVTIIL